MFQRSIAREEAGGGGHRPPPTYAEILSKVQARDYVRQDRRFIPTPLGRLVIDLMREGFDEFFQTEYTANMEEELDDVEEGKIDWRQALARLRRQVLEGPRRRQEEDALRQGRAHDAGRARSVHRFRLTNDPGDTSPRAATR